MTLKVAINKLLTMIIFGLVAIFGVVPIINLVNDYIVRNTDYFQVEAVSLDSESYYQCETLTITIVKSSQVNDADASGLRELIQIIDSKTGDPALVEVEKNAFRPGLTTGKEILVGKVRFDCDIDPGKYFIRYIINYTHEGIPKSYSFRTPEFEFIEKP